MRIVIDYTPAVHQGAGIGRHTRGLVGALAPLTAGHTVTLLVFGAPRTGPVNAPPGMAVRTLPLSNRWLTVGWHRLGIPLPVETLCGPADLYHASDFVLPPLRQARGLLTVHDLSFLTTPDCADAGLRAYLSRVVPRSVARASHILADSDSTRRDLVALLGVAPEQITVVYPGVEARFQPQQDPAALQRVRQRYGLGDKPFVLGVGTLEPRKNWPALIRAWTLMRQESRLPHHLVIAGGQGWLAEGIFQAAQSSPLAHDIHFTGFVEDADLPALYAAAELFAFPSRYEGFGIPVIEAMACGTPVVCADNSSLVEAAGDAALLVPAHDEQGLSAALQILIEDSELRGHMTKQGLAHASRFTWPAAAAALWQSYHQVYYAA
ncbi:MAG: glycosyltransferase family 1 protein [Anaerolineae bacterium]